MSTATTYLREKLGDHVLLGTAYTAPSDLYVALFTTEADVDGSGTEVDGGSYAREVITFTAGAEDGWYVNNSTSITDMPEATVVAIAIMDDDTAGNMLYFANFSAVSVDASDTYPINAGVMTIKHQ